MTCGTPYLYALALSAVALIVVSTVRLCAVLADVPFPS